MSEIKISTANEVVDAIKFGDSAEILLPVKDFISDGVYSRTIFIPAGVIVIGAVHLTAGVGILASGTLQVITNGEVTGEITAPYIFKSEAGSQKLVKAITDVVYTTTHRTDSTTCLEAEVELFDGIPQLTRIKNSYNEFLLTIGNTDEEIQELMLPAILEPQDIYYIGKSIIQGVGSFVKNYTQIGDVIGVSTKGAKRLGLARYMNHSDIPNCEYVVDANGMDVFVKAIRHMVPHTEITVDYTRSLG